MGILSPGGSQLGRMKSAGVEFGEWAKNILVYVSRRKRVRSTVDLPAVVGDRRQKLRPSPRSDRQEIGSLVCVQSMEGRVKWSGKVKLNGHGSKDATGVAASRRGSIADKAVRVADSVVDGPVHGGELVGYGLLFFESCLSSRFCWIFWWRWRNLWRRRRLFGRQLIFVRSIVSFVLWREDVRRRLFGHFLVSFLSGRWRRCRCSRPLELRLKTAGGRVERISVQLRCQLLC